MYGEKLQYNEHILSVAGHFIYLGYHRILVRKRIIAYKQEYVACSCNINITGTFCLITLLINERIDHHAGDSSRSLLAD